jgi:hypothetical protein
MPGLRIGWAVAPTDVISSIWQRHDYTTLTPGAVSDELAAVAMEAQKREWILARTRSILNTQLPRLEEWMGTHRDIFRYIAPKAGGIAFVEYNLPINSTELIDRIRRERSVLLVPGDTLGVGRGIRFGYGYDIEHTMAGLARVDEVLAEITR